MSEAQAAGFRAHPDTLHLAGQAAKRIGADLTDLSGQVRPACDAVSPAPAGMDTGSTLLRVGPLWEQHLRHLAAEVQAVGGTLLQTAYNYDAADLAVRSSLLSIAP